MSSSVSFSHLPILKLGGCYLFSTILSDGIASCSCCSILQHYVFSQPLNWQWLATLSYQKMLLPLTAHTTLPTTKLHGICWLTAELGKSIIAKLRFSKFAGFLEPKMSVLSFQTVSKVYVLCLMPLHLRVAKCGWVFSPLSNNEQAFLLTASYNNFENISRGIEIRWDKISMMLVLGDPKMLYLQAWTQSQVLRPLGSVCSLFQKDVTPKQSTKLLSQPSEFINTP